MEAIAGRYEVTHPLSRAGCIEVHAADDRWLRRSVALALSPARACSPTDRAQFEATGRVLGRLSHPHVADTYDLGRHGGSLFVVFERPGTELASELAEGPWDEERVARLAVELTAGLDALHRGGACHGSVHPGCVGLRPDGSVRLTPWPVAEPPPGWGGPSGWLAPERIAGDAASVRADLWSAAAVLLSALIGAGPGSLDDQELAEMIGQLRRSTGPALLAALATALHRDPADRYASASEMEAALVAARGVPDGAEAAGDLVGVTAGSAPWPDRVRAAGPLVPPRIRLRRLQVPRPPLGRWGWRGAAVGLAALCIPIAALETENAPPAPASCIKGAPAAACSAGGANRPDGHGPARDSGAPTPEADAAGPPAALVAGPAAPPAPPAAVAGVRAGAPISSPAPPPHPAAGAAPPATAPARPPAGGPGADAHTAGATAGASAVPTGGSQNGAARAGGGQPGPSAHASRPGEGPTYASSNHGGSGQAPSGTYSSWPGAGGSHESQQYAQ